MTTATTTVATPPRRRSTRTAAAATSSLARFRYRESETSDEEKEEKEEEEENTNATIKNEDEYAHEDSDSSSLSELSFHSDIEDAIAPRRRTKSAAKTAVATKAIKATAATSKSTTAVNGKRKRAGTTATTMASTTTALPSHTVKRRSVMLRRGIKAEEDDDDDDDAAGTPEREPKATTSTATTKTTTTTTTKKTKKTKVEGAADDDPAFRVAPPPNWEEVYALVKAMRLGDGPAAHAAVDTMGCERLALPTASARDRRFHTLVALMLSSQTKDTVNAAAMARLHAELPPHAPGAPPGLCLANLLAVEPALLNQLIGQVGFHNNKTRYLKQAAVLLRDQWGGDKDGVPVPGIGVDVHVHRITNLWGWHGRPGSATAVAAAKTPENTRKLLQSWLPRARWRELNWLLVGFGQTVCLPQGARCGDCTLGLRGLCRAANRKKVAEGRKRHGETAAAAVVAVKTLDEGDDEKTRIKMEGED
ncbi:DNA repair protein [Niveomyces insectorum RCEF 264]|uniref:DNA repair protein n=1 Tax=Niveomyces insectorum RCEF 264 TaxID=1081102 RepID=A0A167S096_9HYPO|nr:DNA repair protein [Niveomyces insectorum RCEF 264]